MGSKGKRKQSIIPRPDLEQDWEKLDKMKSIAKYKKLDATKVVIMKTQVVKRGNGNKYIPIQNKEFVTINGAFTYEDIYSSIWIHYSSKRHLDLHSTTHKMQLLLTKNGGPKVSKLEHIGNKRELFVNFKMKKHVAPSKNVKINEELVESSTSETAEETEGSSSSNEPVMTKSSYNESLNSEKQKPVAETSTPSVKKSVVPSLLLTQEDLLALGMTLPELSYDKAKLRSLVFDVATNRFAWSEWQNVRINKGSLLGSGGFRDAFRCCVLGNPDMTDTVYVLKFYQEHAIDYRMKTLALMERKECTETHASKDLNMKAVQTISLAKMLAEIFRKKIAATSEKDLCLPSYVQSWVVEYPDGSYATVEQFIEGDFVKYFNNSMGQTLFAKSSVDTEKAEAYAHFTYDFGRGGLMVTDIQGVGMKLTDPEIATTRQYAMNGDTGEMVFGAGNLPQALLNFAENHMCNSFCRIGKLNKITDRKES